MKLNNWMLIIGGLTVILHVVRLYLQHYRLCDIIIPVVCGDWGDLSDINPVEGACQQEQGN